MLGRSPRSFHLEKKGRLPAVVQSSSRRLDNLVMKPTLTFQIEMPRRPSSRNIVCGYFVPRTAIFPNTRKHEHIMMSVFMSWEQNCKCQGF